MKKTFALAALAVGALPLSAADLKEAVFTQVVNEVLVLPQGATQPKAAASADPFKNPDIMKTGKAAMAELRATDKTITRVGANTVFSFEEKGRNIRLEQGSILFHSPKGKGGGTIKSGGASAAVLGTTLLVTANPAGGFKAVILEGKGKVTSGGETRILKAGQVTFVLPNGKLGPVLDINLGRMVRDSRLVNGFNDPLPSLPSIQSAIAVQERLIASGRAEETTYLIGSKADENSVEVVDATTIERAVAAADPRFSLALTLDSSINSEVELDQRHLFIEPVQVQESFFAGLFTGYAARNLIIDVPFFNFDAIGAGGVGTFEFLAAETLLVNETINLFNFEEGSEGFALAATSESPGRRLNVIFTGVENFAIDGDIYAQTSGNLQLRTRGDLLIAANDVQNYQGELNIRGATVDIILAGLFGADGLFVRGTQVTASDSVLDGFVVDLAGTEQLNVEHSSIAGSDIILRAGSFVLARNSDFNNFASLTMLSGGDLEVDDITFDTFENRNFNTAAQASNPSEPFEFSWNLVANETLQVTVPRADLSALTSINMTAKTLVLTDVNFASGNQVTLRSRDGVLASEPNTNRPVVEGQVNFVRGVSYGGVLLNESNIGNYPVSIGSR